MTETLDDLLDFNPRRVNDWFRNWDAAPRQDGPDPDVGLGLWALQRKANRGSPGADLPAAAYCQTNEDGNTCGRPSALSARNACTHHASRSQKRTLPFTGAGVDDET